jgi:sugar (glycoside-pentoside-hexuronide) transporter
VATRLGWAVGEFAIASHMAILSIYLLYYLTDVQKVPSALAGTLILIPRLWNVVSDPLMGGVSDRFRSRWGRRRPFLLAGALVWGIAYAAMFAIPTDWTLTAKAAWFLAACFAVNTGLSLYHVPYSAMLPEMTDDVSDRLALTGYKEIAARFAVLITVMASPLIVHAAPDPVAGHRWVGFATGAFIILSGLTAFFATAHAPSRSLQASNATLAEQWGSFRTNRQLFRLSGAYLFSSACDAFYSAMMIYFVTIALRLDGGLMGVLYPVGSVTAIVATPLWAALGRRIGRRLACAIAYSGAAIVFCLALLVPVGVPALMFPFMVLVGAFFGGVFMLPSAMTPDTVELDEKRSGQRREGAIYGTWIFTQQTGMSIGAFLVGIYLDLIGYHPGTAAAATANASAATAIRYGFALAPAGLLLVAAALVRGLAIGGPVVKAPGEPLSPYAMVPEPVAKRSLE